MEGKNVITVTGDTAPAPDWLSDRPIVDEQAIEMRAVLDGAQKMISDLQFDREDVEAIAYEQGFADGADIGWEDEMTYRVECTKTGRHWPASTEPEAFAIARYNGLVDFEVIEVKP